jgi:hypothetical protein
MRPPAQNLKHEAGSVRLGLPFNVRSYS